MVKNRKNLAAALTLVSVGLISGPAQAADMYAVRLCTQIQSGDTPGVVASLEALGRMGFTDVALDGQRFSIRELLGAVRDGGRASKRLQGALTTLQKLSLLQDGYTHAQRDCSEIVDRPASGAIEALLDGTFATSNARVQAFAPGSEG